MESNWRYNVYAVGLSDSEYELCARWNVLGEWYVTKRTLLGLTVRTIIQVVFPGTLPVVRSNHFVTPSEGHFPWGFDVLPD